MSREKEIDKLHKAESDFIMWLDNVNYSGANTDIQAPHYKLIEGFKDGKERRVAFIYDALKGKAYVSINTMFPNAEQKLTIDQFYEWMQKPVSVMMQDQDFELSDKLRSQIKEHFKTLQYGSK